MGWFKRNEEIADVVEEPKVVAPPVPVAEAIKPQLAVDELAEYSRVAAEIGIIDQPALLRERLERFFADENIHVFSNESVVAYLDSQFGAGGWEWRGLRQADAEYLGGWHTTTGNRRIDFSDRVYNRSIPLPVLLTVQKVAKAFPEVHFYISNQKSSDGDPFLAVTTRDIRVFIIERWDEPSFRDGEAE